MSKSGLDKLIEQVLSEKTWKEPPADIKTARDFSFYKSGMITVVQSEHRYSQSLRRPKRYFK